MVKSKNSSKNPGLNWLSSWVCAICNEVCGKGKIGKVPEQDGREIAYILLNVRSLCPERQLWLYFEFLPGLCGMVVEKALVEM